MIPLTKKLDVPSEAPLKWPEPPQLPELGTTGGHAKALSDGNDNERDEMKRAAIDERDKRETEGRGDRYSERQRVSAPKIDTKIIGFPVELLCEYTDEDGETYLDWAHGTVVEIKNKDKCLVNIKWAEECVAEGEASTTTERLEERLWNKSKKSAWRQYLAQ